MRGVINAASPQEKGRRRTFAGKRRGQAIRTGLGGVKDQSTRQVIYSVLWLD